VAVHEVDHKEKALRRCKCVLVHQFCSKGHDVSNWWRYIR